MNDIDDLNAPTSVTKTFIKAQRDVFTPLEAYMTSLLEHLDTSYRTVVKEFPAGLRLLFLHWRFWTDVDNGGFTQFLGNASAIDHSGQVIVDTVEALQSLGLKELAGWLQDAIAIRSTELPLKALQACQSGGGQVRRGKPLRRPRLSEQQKAEALWDLDQKFNALNYSWFPRVNKYIKTHPAEFVHGGRRIK